MLVLDERRKPSVDSKDASAMPDKGQRPAASFNGRAESDAMSEYAREMAALGKPLPESVAVTGTFQTA